MNFKLTLEFPGSQTNFYSLKFDSHIKSEYRIFRDQFYDHKDMKIMAASLDLEDSFERYSKIVPFKHKKYLKPQKEDYYIYRFKTDIPSLLHLYCITFDDHNIIIGNGCLKEKGSWQKHPIAAPIVYQLIECSKVIKPHRADLIALYKKNYIFNCK